MVRTRDGGARKAVAAKAPRKVLASSGGGGMGGLGSPSSSKNKYAGGNPVCPRPTPEWQKGIGAFCSKGPKKTDKENTEPMEDNTEIGTSSSAAAATSSSSKPDSPSASQQESPVKNGLIDSDED